MFDAPAWRNFTETIGNAAAGMTGEAAVAAMVRVATSERNRVLGGTPKPSGYRQIVDDIEGAPLTSVHPDGVIVFAWTYMAEIARKIRDLFISRAPVVTGNYVRNILVLIDRFDLTIEDITGDTKEIVIVPAAVYARRLEVGRRGDTASKIVRKWAHNVERTAIIARSLYGEFADISFNHIHLVGSYQLRTSASHRKVRGHLITDVQYPAIIIKPRSA